MRKFILFLLFMTISIALFGQLGLRTLTPEATQTTPAVSPLETLTLRTVDPLLQSFRDGWKEPEDPTWTSFIVGNRELKLPQHFSISTQKYDVNYDVRIYDSEGRLFGWLFYYQLESYDLQELLNTVVSSVYGDKATGEKPFEEKRSFDNGLAAYLASLKITGQTVDFPSVIVYSPKESLDVTSAGSVAIFFFEPSNFTGPALDMAKSWIAGVVGSFVYQTEAIVEPVVTPEIIEPPVVEVTVPDDPFIRIIASLLAGEDVEIENIDSWKDVEGEYFGFAMPPEFSVEFLMGDGFEVADLGIGGMILAKFMVGEFYESAVTTEILGEIVGTYLGAFGGYSIAASHTIKIEGESSINLYALDFSGQFCWIALFSESPNPETFGPGEFFVFLGLVDPTMKDQLAGYYAGMLATLNF
ncbi:MAG: hypothetical protein AB2L23_07680 [Mesotoga sp.]|nr:hypothetical protein [Mesotoga sp.]